MYDDAKANLQEMLDISTIWKSYSQWASAVVLVKEKDENLRFCITIR